MVSAASLIEAAATSVANNRNGATTPRTVAPSKANSVAGASALAPLLVMRHLILRRGFNPHSIKVGTEAKSVTKLWGGLKSNQVQVGFFEVNLNGPWYRILFQHLDLAPAIIRTPKTGPILFGALAVFVQGSANRSLPAAPKGFSLCPIGARPRSRPLGQDHNPMHQKRKQHNKKKL